MKWNPPLLSLLPLSWRNAAALLLWLAGWLSGWLARPLRSRSPLAHASPSTEESKSRRLSKSPVGVGQQAIAVLCACVCVCQRQRLDICSQAHSLAQPPLPSSAKLTVSHAFSIAHSPALSLSLPPVCLYTTPSLLHLITIPPPTSHTPSPSTFPCSCPYIPSTPSPSLATEPEQTNHVKSGPAPRHHLITLARQSHRIPRLLHFRNPPSWLLRLRLSVSSSLFAFGIKSPPPYRPHPQVTSNRQASRSTLLSPKPYSGSTFQCLDSLRQYQQHPPAENARKRPTSARVSSCNAPRCYHCGQHTAPFPLPVSPLLSRCIKRISDPRHPSQPLSLPRKLPGLPSGTDRAWLHTKPPCKRAPCLDPSQSPTFILQEPQSIRRDRPQ